MCGIVGHYLMNTTLTAPSQSVLASMAETLHHRGPDDTGFHIESRIGLGFKRLSIVDLHSGMQPHYNENRDIVSVVNGEIYNHRELRQELIEQGHQFRTQSDVEVVVHLYEEYGVDFVNKLNGQFAIALYDQQHDQLLLVRDHVGIAPLFYAELEGQVVFASEIKALLAFPDLKPKLDRVALDQMFSFPGIISPRTMFEGIKAVPPGHRVLIQGSSVEVEEYWDLVYPTQDEVVEDHGEQYYIDGITEILKDAVALRLMADVPVGFYLSGGLDSSMLASIIHEIDPERQRHSFSIGFEQKQIDERPFQQLMVDKVGSIHHTRVFGAEDVASWLQQAVYYAETPLKESYNTCSLRLSELVNDSDLKVVITGEGADELFGGYVGYRMDGIRDPDEDMDAFEAMQEQEIRERLFGDDQFLYERQYTEFQDIKYSLYADEDEAQQYDATEYPPLDLNKLRGRCDFHKRSYIDFKLRMSDHLLADHGDRVAMAHSVEARYPFLDVRLIEFVAKIPPHYMIQNGEEKYLLKQVAKNWVPQEIINRQKFAFVAPGSPYLLRQNIEWVEQLLSYERIEEQGIFCPETVDNLKAMYRSEDFAINQTFENDLLMVILTFQIFYDRFFKEAA
jgi:asparagine synthase (glutamine-hydrolysing)